MGAAVIPRRRVRRKAWHPRRPARLQPCRPLAVTSGSAGGRVLRLHGLAVYTGAALTVGVTLLPVSIGREAREILCAGAGLSVARVARIAVRLRSRVALVSDQFADDALILQVCLRLPHLLYEPESRVSRVYQWLLLRFFYNAQCILQSVQFFVLLLSGFFGHFRKHSRRVAQRSGKLLRWQIGPLIGDFL